MSPLLVLCIDDRMELLRIRKAGLEKLGFAVAMATTAAVAILILQRTAVAAVIVDYKMEGLDSEAIVFHIKQRFPDVPVVLVSSYSDVPERVLWLVDEYVMKSEPVERIAGIIERLSRQSRSTVRQAAS